MSLRVDAEEPFVLSLAQALGIPQDYDTMESLAEAVREAGTLVCPPTQSDDGSWFFQVKDGSDILTIWVEQEEAIAFAGAYGPEMPGWE